MGQAKPGRIEKAAPSKPCPICTAPSEAQFKPFCSRRCADVDLLRWLNGSYVIAGGAADADEDGDDSKVQWDAKRPDKTLPDDNFS